MKKRLTLAKQLPKLIAKKDRVRKLKRLQKETRATGGPSEVRDFSVREGPLVTLSFSRLLSLARIPTSAAHKGVLIVLFAFRVLSFLVA